MWWFYLIFISLGSISAHGASGILLETGIPLYCNPSPLKYYPALSIFIVAINGYLINSWTGILIIGIGVLIGGMVLWDFLLPKKYYESQFWIFGSANILLTIVHIFL